MEAVLEPVAAEEQVLFEPPRFIEEESGHELLVDCDGLDAESIRPGEIVHVVKPGNRKTHYRILKLEQAAPDGQATAYVKEAPPIYGKALLLFALLALAWFGLDKIFDLLF